MNSKTTARPHLSPAASILATALLALHGCSSGSGGSDVDASRSSPPVARPLVLNSGASNTVREGAEVLLTGRDSDDADGPLLEWSWTAPPGIELTTRSRTTVSFTAPAVEVATTYPITLTVLDTDGATGTAAVDVRVVPARDPNLFLAPRAGQVAAPDVATLTVALAPGTAVGPLDVPFTVELSATVSYVSRTNVQERVDLDVDWLAAPRAGHWPAGETVECSPGQRAEPCMLGSWINSRYQFQVPRLDVAELNQRFIASGELGRQLDPHRADSAVVEVHATLEAAGLQNQAYLLLSHDGSVIAQAPPSPIGVPAALSVTTDVLLAGLGGEEQRATAEAYYRTVDPRGRRQTLSDWLFAAGFADSGGALLPEALAGSGDFAHAKYTNNYDLGFGRDMYSRVEPNGNVYSFVVNYRTLEGTIKNTDSFVTVAMEFTPPDDPSLHASCLTRGRFVKFFTYVPDGTGDSTRVTSIDFDGRGERHTPGNCVACHGGTLGTLTRLVPNPVDPAQALYRDCGDTGGTFLPWDLDSFLYSDTDPAILAGAPRPDGTPFATHVDPEGRFRRGPQEEQFRKLNAAALATYETYVAEGGDAARIAAVTDLVHGWYGGRPKEPGARFGGAYTPPGWDVSPAVANVYHTAFARYCRSCHLQLTDTSKQLATYADLIVNPLTGAARTLEDLVYRRGVMPFARLTADRFWVPFAGTATAAEVLAAQLATDLGSDPKARPGAPVFDVTRTPNPTKHGDVVRLSARNSTFVQNPRWSALATMAGDACVAPATLVGASTLEVTFRTGAPGRYCIELTSGAASVVEQFDVVPNQAPVLVPKSRLTIDANAGPTSVDLEYGDADDPPAALEFTLTRQLNGIVTVGGAVAPVGSKFTQPQLDAGEVRFEPRLPGPLAVGALASGGFDFAVTDGVATLGMAPALEYRVDIRGVSAGHPAVSVQSVLPSELFFGGTAAIGASKIEVTDTDTPAANLIVNAAVAAGATGSVTPAALSYQQLLGGGVFTYTHGGSLRERVLITVSDATSATTPLPLAVNARVSFANNLTPIVNGACADRCHAAGPLSFRIGGTVSYNAMVSGARVPFPENACTSPQAAPSGPLLRKPTASDELAPPTGHAGGVRDGFDLTGDRTSYDLFRYWICNFEAANN